MEFSTNDPNELTFKQNFEEKLRQYTLQHQGSTRTPWTQEKILKVITSIKNARKSMIKTNMSYYWISKYDITTAGKHEYLIIKRKNDDDPIIKIIPLEEYFNTLYTIHINCGHGRRDKMISALKSHLFIIPRNAVEIFTSLCPTCNTKRKISKEYILRTPVVSNDYGIEKQNDSFDLQPYSDEEIDTKRKIIEESILATTIVSNDDKITESDSSIDLQLCSEETSSAKVKITKENILESTIVTNNCYIQESDDSIDLKPCSGDILLTPSFDGNIQEELGNKVNFKKKFEDKLREYVVQHQGSRRTPWTQKKIFKVISSIKNARKSTIETKTAYYWLSKYDIVTERKQEYLIIKRKNDDDPIIKIIPLEDYFETLYTIHNKCGHGGRDKMISAIKSHLFIIPRTSVEIFTSLCPICNTKKKIPKENTVQIPNVSNNSNIKGKGQISLMDFESRSDGEYKWQDDTKFLNHNRIKTEMLFEVTNEFNFKQIFEEKLRDYEIKHQGSYRMSWTQRKILQVISRIKNTKKSKTKTKKSYCWLSKYDIMTTKNEEYLIIKRKSADDPIIKVVQREEYFDTLYTIHNDCGHGGRDKTVHAIKNRYYIPKKAVEIFISLCPTCNTRRKIPNTNKKTTQTKPVKPIISNDFNIRGQVDLIDFQSCPDGEYKWLLNYQDNATRFVSLRPLKTKIAREVATELVKIFLIFGAPYILQSHYGYEFTAKVIEELIGIWPDSKIIPSDLIRPQKYIELENKDVGKIIRSWMEENNSTNWSVGCHFVQYQKNLSFHSNNGSSPYEAVFGNSPKPSLKDTDIPPQLLMNIETEEQLKNLIDGNITEMSLKVECFPDLITSCSCLTNCNCEMQMDEYSSETED